MYLTFPMPIANIYWSALTFSLSTVWRQLTLSNVKCHCQLSNHGGSLYLCKLLMQVGNNLCTHSLTQLSAKVSPSLLCVRTMQDPSVQDPSTGARTALASFLHLSICPFDFSNLCFKTFMGKYSFNMERQHCRLCISSFVEFDQYWIQNQKQY